MTQNLVRIDTSRGDEASAINLLATMLEEADFGVTWVPWQPDRPNLIATWRGGGPLTLAAHLDTVPFESSTWTVDPLGGQIIDGRLYGRGSSDMKAGAAAMVCAAIEATGSGCEPFSMVFTSAEETGCWGARAVAASGLLQASPILVVGEATDNELRFGHKGATWLELIVRGKAAHGSRPELGDSAVLRLADTIVALRGFHPSHVHSGLGSMTTNVGTIDGGQQTNLVPDRATMTVDVRTPPGQDARDVRTLLEKTSGGAVAEVLSIPSVWTDPSTSLSRRLSNIVASVTGVESRGEGVSYFTDGAVLADPSSPTVFIIGPGGIDQPHTSDESCRIDRIEETVAVYRALLERVPGTGGGDSG